MELQRELEQALQELAQARAELSTLVDAAHTLEEDRERLQKKVAELQAVVDRLTNMVWGRRSEKRVDPDQINLFDLKLTPEELSEKQREIITAEDVLDDATMQQMIDDILRRRKKRRLEKLQEQGREEFPANLERRRVVLDLDEDAKEGLTLLGTKVFERLRLERPRVYVEVVERREYVRCQEPEAGVISPPAPLAIAPGVKYDFSVIAAIVEMKYWLHQPTYRQQDVFAQAGFFMSRSTINDLLNYTVSTVKPLFQEAWRMLLQQPILLGDDTRIRLLTRGALTDEELERLSKRSGSPSGTGPPGSITSYAWLYTGLDTMAPYNIFHWSLTHEDCWIDSHLASFQGIFVGDATGPNARLEQRSQGRIMHAGCNAHARREFVEAEKTHPRHAATALAYYLRLYEIEQRGKWLSDAERLALRQREAVPVWNAFEKWLDSDELTLVLPKSPLGQALTYMRNHRVALKRYLSDPRLPIDNNQSERAIRPLTIGRRNWTFLGHPDAAAGRMELLSIASSAHRHHLLIYDYLVDILPKLAYAQQHDPQLLEPGSDYLQQLLPDRWAVDHPQSVCQQRREEREDVAETKRLRRLQRRLAERQAQRAAQQGDRSETTAGV